MSKILGISSMFHDAAACVVENGEILFAGHAERYSKEKNDPFINEALMLDALSYGMPDVIVLHEKTWAKRLRNIAGRQWNGLKEPSAEEYIRTTMPFLDHVPIKSYWHHETHAAAGVLTSEFDSAAVMVIDAIGEFDTASIWHWKDNVLTKKHSVWFPNSLGLFYSAVTAHVGLKPMEDEYILMGMAAYGDKDVAEDIAQGMRDIYFKGNNPINMRENLQRGLTHKWWLDSYKDMDIARAAQIIAEEKVLHYAEQAKQLTGEDNFVFMGGVALNCVANSNLFSLFKNIHIMPNPGDAGSSLGAAALEYHSHTGGMINWTGPYLGHNIEGAYPVNKALNALKENKIFGIANGRAEFGPRALGNRSLIADPRGGDIKDRVNAIKKRQEFRPFAPVILEEQVHDYFEMPNKCLSPYMQFVAECKQPEKFPAIVHADGTSRVQTVNKTQHPGLHELIFKFFMATGCPMILNTSLNVKGKPIVNDEKDAREWSMKYGRPVFTCDD